MILIYLILTVFLRALTDVFIFAYRMQKIGKLVRETPFVLMFYYLTNYNYQTKEDWMYLIVCFGFLAGSLFDTFYNILALRPFFYKGDNSYWDDLMKKLSNWQYITLKSFLLLIALLVYFKQLA